MPKKGGKKKNKKNSGPVGTKRVLIYKGDMEEYAQMTKMLGDRRIIVMLPDKTETMAIIPGRFRKRCWIKVGMSSSYLGGTSRTPSSMSSTSTMMRRPDVWPRKTRSQNSSWMPPCLMEVETMTMRTSYGKILMRNQMR